MDKAKKKTSKVFAVLLLMVVGIVCAIRIILINQKFHAPMQQQYGMHEVIDYKGLEISVVDAYFMQSDDVKLYYEESLDIVNDVKAVVIEIKMKNITQEQVPMGYFYLFTLETAAYSNGNDLLVLDTINDPSIFKEFIEPGESVTVKIPFEIWDIAFKSNTWKQLESEKFYLTTALHPSVIRVKLEL